MYANDWEIVGPGEQLKQVFRKLIPFDHEMRHSFVSRIDDMLMADNDFTLISYESSINYLVRRFITTVEFIKRRYDPTQYPSERYIVEIRRFIRDYTRIPSSEIEKVLTILLACLELRDKTPTQSTKNRIKKKSNRRGGRCYICGTDMESEDDSHIHRVEVEHKWPRTLGGLNDDSNLFASCRKCNERKQDYLDASDFHYEEISIVSDQDDTDFSKDLKWEYRVALWAKNDFKCVVCNKPASLLGELQFSRKEPNDSWHFLNIDAYCDKHIPRR